MKVNEDMKKIGETIKSVLDEQNISAYTVEKNTSLKHQTIYQWINGTATATILNIIELAKFLDVEIDYLVGLKDKTEKKTTYNENIRKYSKRYFIEKNRFSNRFLGANKAKRQQRIESNK